MMFGMRQMVCLGALLLFGGCVGSGAPSAASGDERSGPPFPGSAPSLDVLGERVLRALAARDTVALGRIRLTESEHNDVIWPELPAARSQVNFPVSYAWENIQRRNDRDLRRILPWYGDRRVRFEKVECPGGIRVFATFRVHTGCTILFETEEHGLLEAEVFEEVAERNGGFKLFRYYDNRPRRRRSGE